MDQSATLSPNFVRLDAATGAESFPPQGAALNASMASAVPGARMRREESATLMTNESILRYVINWENFELRLAEVHYPPDAVSWSRFSTPAGIPVFFGHHTFYSAIGRMQSIRHNANSDSLIGDLLFCEHDGFGNSLNIDAGFNRGLSVGLKLLESEYEERKGNESDPDQITYTSMELMEVSLTPIPALAGAGLQSKETMQ